mmetsp:Transcript_10376/g.31219  ORF Transcript_10376/g.31219 Transcript_10376/m.31219 type:complete len:271 (+) Transcript_10376:1160-1972(+)
MQRSNDETRIGGGDLLSQPRNWDWQVRPIERNSGLCWCTILFGGDKCHPLRPLRCARYVAPRSAASRTGSPRAQQAWRLIRQRLPQLQRVAQHGQRLGVAILDAAQPPPVARLMHMLLLLLMMMILLAAAGEPRVTTAILPVVVDLALCFLEQVAELGIARAHGHGCSGPDRTTVPLRPRPAAAAVVRAAAHRLGLVDGAAASSKITRRRLQTLRFRACARRVGRQVARGGARDAACIQGTRRAMARGIAAYTYRRLGGLRTLRRRPPAL